MGLIRFFAIFLLIYLVFSLIKSLLRSGRRSQQKDEDPYVTNTRKREEKIISKEEGEYVDFEEVD